jgi:hypothetical protein
MPLLKRRSPFDDPAWIFELKYDGFRALAVIEHGRAQLLSISPQGYGGHFTGGRAPLRLDPGPIAGAPTTGNHQKGELYVDNAGSLFFCKADGVPGPWVKLT